MDRLIKTQRLAQIMMLQDAIFEAKTSPGHDDRLSQQIRLKIFKSNERYHPSIICYICHGDVPLLPGKSQITLEREGEKTLG